MARLRTPLLLLAGLFLITFPFLWLQLRPNYATSTDTVIWAPLHGLRFFIDLSPVFALALVIWLINQINFRNLWSARLAQRTSLGFSFLAKYWGGVVVLLILSSAYFLSKSSLGLLGMVAVFMLLAQGLNITVGMTGLLVLGYAGFYAIGAYFLALGNLYLPWLTWWMAAPMAFLFGGGVGYLLGLPCLRLRGDYLAIVTLGFAEAFRETMRNLDFTGGDNGLTLQGGAVFPLHLTTIFGLSLNNNQSAYLVLGLTVLLVFFVVQRIYHSPIGQAWIAIRENEIAASSIGIPVVQMKLLAFSLSAAIAALAGVLYAAKVGYVSPATCDFQTSIMVLAMVILGGLGNTYGALLGATLLYLVPELIKFFPSVVQNSSWLSPLVPDFALNALRHLSDYRLLVFGAIMVVMMLYRPQGLLGSARRKLEMREGTSP